MRLPAQDLAEMLMEMPGFDPDTFDFAKFAETLTPEMVDAAFEQVEKATNYIRQHRFRSFFPENGPLRRALYPRHMEFFEAGKDYSERLFMAANRVGKTVAGSYEAAAHATGLYPQWWPGRRFTHPTHGWAAGDTNETTRDIIQKELFGDVAWDGNKKGFDGSGMIPGHLIMGVTWKQGVANMADTVRIRHSSHHHSTIGLKSYDQGRRVFQGTAKHWIWLDEEGPLDVYGECLMRLMTTQGLIFTTFTPLLGMSELVMSFLPDDLRLAD